MKDNKREETTTRFPVQVIAIDEGKIKSHVEEAVGGSVEETLNSLLDAEADIHLSRNLIKHDGVRQVCSPE